MVGCVKEQGAHCLQLDFKKGLVGVLCGLDHIKLGGDEQQKETYGYQRGGRRPSLPRGILEASRKKGCQTLSIVPKRSMCFSTAHVAWR